ncbi:uncharacterized protein [Macrobrachium rosenbergii]|uniref:uncharacterized protein n=1 Tax=Macrobrachium rosenbergii TaxID=79674 RepID=UPI0034D6FCD5
MRPRGCAAAAAARRERAFRDICEQRGKLTTCGELTDGGCAGRKEEDPPWQEEGTSQQQKQQRRRGSRPPPPPPRPPPPDTDPECGVGNAHLLLPSSSSTSSTSSSSSSSSDLPSKCTRNFVITVVVFVVIAFSGGRTADATPIILLPHPPPTILSNTPTPSFSTPTPSFYSPPSQSSYPQSSFYHLPLPSLYPLHPHPPPPFYGPHTNNSSIPNIPSTPSHHPQLKPRLYSPTLDSPVLPPTTDASSSSSSGSLLPSDFTPIPTFYDPRLRAVEGD